MDKFLLQNLSNSNTKPVLLSHHKTFFQRFKGLMFSKELDPFKGALFTNPSPSRIDTAVHMLFMNYDLFIIWADEKLKIIDSTIAKKWSLVNISKEPASYIFEIHINRKDDFHIGDLVQLNSYDNE